MKILQVIPNLEIGGAEIMCENLTQSLKKLGHEVVIISLFRISTIITRRLEENNIKIIYLDKKPGFDISLKKKLKSIIVNENPDVIHCHLSSFKYIAFAAAKTKFKGNIIYTVHSVAEKDGSALDHIICKKIFHQGKAIPVALSDAIQDTIVKLYKLQKENIPVIFNGIDLSKCIVKDNYDINGNFKILHIGRFTEAKNHLGLLNAFKIFHDKNKNSELIFIGDGEKRIEIESFIESNNLNDSVILLGVKDNVYRYLNIADVFTLPSLYEGIPLTLIEAMGTGLPIVATNVGGIPDMLKNEESALLVDVNDYDIALAFEKLFKDEKLRKNIGKKALSESRCFSSDDVAKKYIQIYK